MFRNILAVVLTVLIIALGAVVITPGARAGDGDAAKLEGKVQVEARPSQQAVGGEVEFVATFLVYGGCCYHLYSYDLVPAVDFPPGMEVISGPEPRQFKEVDGLPGGEPVSNRFVWKVVCHDVGEFNITFYVNSSNSGTAGGSVNVKVTEGSVITMPVVFPLKPETSKDTVLTFDVYSTFEEVKVEKVAMYYAFIDHEDLTLATDKDKLSIEDNGLKKVISGTGLDLVNSADRPRTYRAVLPAQGSERVLCYWIYALDSSGLEVTTFPVVLKIHDLDASYRLSSASIVSLLLAGIIGTVLIVMLFVKLDSFRIRDKTRLFKIGSIGSTEFFKREDRPKELKRTIFYLVVAALVLLGLLLVIISIRTGSFDGIITHLRDGK